LGDFYQKNKSGVLIYRLPGIFGKGCKPNYNSVVATFCHNYINDINVEIDDKERLLELAYIDDLINELLVWIEQKLNGFKIVNLKNIYKIKLGDLAEKISNFHNNRSNLIIDNVGFGIDRALYSTYISYLNAEKVCYSVMAHEDLRGKFFELFKSTIFGQISFFTIKPGVIRGGHYHHTKTEKFFVAKGMVKISHKSLFDNNFFNVVVSDKNPCIVDTIPGYAHQIQNIGSDEAFVIVWANEIFDDDKPDTFAYKGLYD
jgi:UDP-2-acetamido-2,6-beta-L-arabino-hexul-4-ose reductase